MIAMFGTSSLGWVHTLGSLPAIPAAFYMFARRGRITPHSTAGKIYFASMLFGAATVLPITHIPAGYIIAITTIILLLTGYAAGRIPALGRGARYLETISLTLTAFLLMLPTVSEILRRVPDGHPFVTDVKSPLFIGAQLTLFALLIIGLTAQILWLRRQSKATSA